MKAKSYDSPYPIDQILDEYLIYRSKMYKQQQEIEPIVITSATGQPYRKDWKDYHERGLKFAHELRKRLSTDIDLWYVAPYEDKSGIIDHPILIL